MKNKLYESSMAIMALISIILIILDYGSVINIDRGYPALLNNVLLGIFTIDYFSRLYLAKDKKGSLRKIFLTCSPLFRLVPPSTFSGLHA